MISKQVIFEAELSDSVEVKSDERVIGWANKYEIVIKYNGKQGKFEFTDSVNNTNEGNEPNKKDVLSCLVMDYQSESTDFDEFCHEFGYDSDSRKAEKIFKAIQKNHEKMARIFGSDIEQLQKEFENY